MWEQSDTFSFQLPEIFLAVCITFLVQDLLRLKLCGPSWLFFKLIIAKLILRALRSQTDGPSKILSRGGLSASPNVWVGPSEPLLSIFSARCSCGALLGKMILPREWASLKLWRWRHKVHTQYLTLKTAIGSVAWMSLVVLCRKKTKTSQHLHKAETRKAEWRDTAQSHL